MRRDHSAFISGFTGALGVFLAIAVVGVASFYYVREQWRDTFKPPPAPTSNAWRIDRAKQLAKPHLAKHGIQEISDESKVSDKAGDVLLYGHGRDARGNLHEFTIRFSVASFGGKEHWKIEATMIDKKLVYIATNE